jgi:uncharacterized protein YkwD
MPNYLLHLFVPHHTNNQRAKLLHPSVLSVVIGVFVLFQIAINQLAIRYPQILGYASNISTEEILRLTNIQRKINGAGEVRLDSQLNSAAAQKAADMMARDYWAHISPIGTQPWAFINDSGYAYRYAGENLARDFSDPESVVKAWMASPSHRDNLINGRYQDMGIAVVDGKLGGRETTLVVQMFGTKISSPFAMKLPVSISVKAAEINQPIASSNISRFEVTKYASLFLVVLFIVLLVIDIFIVMKKGIVRWTSRSFAHLLLMTTLVGAIVIISRGQII